MPVFGLGTYAMDNYEAMKKAITELGYRMIDCASFYKNEEMVGKVLNEVLEEKVVAREDLFIVSKVYLDELDDIEAACRRSL